LIKLLVVNVYFAPRSFGGATIVAEEVCLELARKGYLPLVVTSISDATLPEYHLIRYRSKGLDIVAVNLPQKLTYEDVYSNPRFADAFREITAAFQPDIIHMHSVQLLGAGIAQCAIDNNLPYCITMHDCWWICERQFMVNREGNYCFQKHIDHAVCAYCVDESDKAVIRRQFLRRVVGHAALTLYPSHFHCELYLANGAAGDTARVNRNGVRMPNMSYRRRQSRGDVVFGFVGGPGATKGSDVMLKAFERIERTDYQLLLVDAARNLGKSWAWEMSKWSVGGRVSIVNAYTQDTLDDFFSKIDVLLFPSQWKESFGLTVREALARDVWVVVTDGGGPVEDVRDGENGEVVPIGHDPAPLACAIERAFDRNWSKYRNPYVGELQTYAGQASELDGFFRDVLGFKDSVGVSLDKLEPKS